MPAFDSTAPRFAVTVAKVALTAPTAYAEGHVLTANEASFLSRAVAQAVANPLATAISNAAKEGKVYEGWDNPQALYDERFAAYVVGGTNRAAAETIDPVTKAARQLAEPKVNELIKAKGRKINEIKAAKDEQGNSVYVAMLDRYIALNPSITQLAEMQIAAMAELDSGFDLGDLPEAEVTTETATTEEPAH